MRRLFITFCFLLFSCGCATVTGPGASPREIQQATEELQVKSLAYKLNQIKRVNVIGYRIVNAIAKEDIKTPPRPFTGLFCISRSKIAERLFNARLDRGVFVAFVLENTPVYEAGLTAGDILVAINKKQIDNAANVTDGKLKAGEEAVVTIFRDGGRMDIPVNVASMPLGVNFTVVDEQSVNAAAGPKNIYVTYGLLNFAKSDDEIAAVLAHELGHFARGHVNRMQGSNIVGAIAAIGLGIAAEALAPGSGSTVMRGVGGIGDVFKARFSRDLEREADYFGVKYMYLAGYDPEVAIAVHERFAIEIPASMTRDFFSTHPSSPERAVRLRKAIDELKNPPKNISPEPAKSPEPVTTPEVTPPKV